MSGKSLELCRCARALWRRLGFALALAVVFAPLPARGEGAAPAPGRSGAAADARKRPAPAAAARRPPAGAPSAVPAARPPQSPPPSGIKFSHNTIVDFSFTGGEPFINAAPVNITPNTPAGSPFISAPFGFSTTVSLLWKSIDGGRTFIPLGAPILRDAVTAPGGGDTHQDFDAKGRFYYSDLSAACVTTAVSDDGGNTFTKINPVACIGPGDPGMVQDDRQWSGAFGDGRGYMTVRNLLVSTGGGNFHLNRTRDAGQTWLAAQPIGNVTQSGPLIVDKTKRNIGGADYILAYQIYYSGGTLKMFRIQDPDTGGAVTVRDLTIGTPGGAVATVFPVAAVDTAGHLYVTWSSGSGIFMMTSTDRGETWSNVKRVSPLTGDAGAGTIVMPWVVAGDPGRVNVVWYRGSMAGNSTSTNNRWDIYMAQSLNAHDLTPAWSYAKVNEHNIHFGEICLNGLNCDLAVPPGSRDRSFLEFPSITIDHRGAAMVTWNDNTNQSGVTAANAAVTGAPHVMFSKQVCGPSLYASVGELGEGGEVAVTAPAAGSVTAPDSVTVRGTHTLPPDTFDRDEPGDARFPDHGPAIGNNVPALDLRQVEMSETPTHLVVRMRVADATPAALAAAPALSGGDGLLYLTQWDYDESPADPIDRVFWVAAEVRGGVPVARTGTLGVVRSATSKKFITYNPDAVASQQVTVDISNTAPGTITLSIPRGLAGSPPAGAQLKSVTGYALSERGALAATPCPEPPASCENVFNPASLPVQVDASGAFTYVVGGGMRLDGVVEVSLDDPTFSNPASAAVNLDGTWQHTFDGPGAGAHTVYARQVVRSCAASETKSVGFVVPGTGPLVNHALTSLGAVPVASSVYPNGDYSAAGAFDGDRRGLNWSRGGGWNDATRSLHPDSLEVAFSGEAKVINEVRVYTLQDNFADPQEPTPEMITTGYGLLDYDVQYWDGARWVTAPGGQVRGNNRVMRAVTFPAVLTSKVRVLVHNARAHFSRVVELEALGPSGP